jgi:hypothetical protein
LRDAAGYSYGEGRQPGGNPTQFVRHEPSLPGFPLSGHFPEALGLKIIMRLTDDNGEIIFVTIAAGKFHEWNVGSTKSAISTPASQPPTAHFSAPAAPRSAR